MSVLAVCFLMKLDGIEGKDSRNNLSIIGKFGV